MLFIDEAAQMSLANVLAVSQGAKSIVLLGDPRQLEQPMQGSHPEGTDVSALDHILGVHATIPADRGLFLEETWRLHPRICAFTSELFYDSRLRSRPGLELQEVKSACRNRRLRPVAISPVAHEGNQNSSPEEADRSAISSPTYSRQTRRGSTATAWRSRSKLDDILIIAPYNAQVFELQDRISGARIGTVDKFQGQEAPIVIYSMTTSSHADAPRGMEFLYSPNRLNVATSRAQMRLRPCGLAPDFRRQNAERRDICSSRTPFADIWRLLQRFRRIDLVSLFRGSLHYEPNVD